MQRTCSPSSSDDDERHRGSTRRRSSHRRSNSAGSVARKRPFGAAGARAERYLARAQFGGYIANTWGSLAEDLGFKCPHVVSQKGCRGTGSGKAARYASCTRKMAAMSALDTALGTLTTLQDCNTALSASLMGSYSR